MLQFNNKKALNYFTYLQCRKTSKQSVSHPFTESKNYNKTLLLHYGNLTDIKKMTDIIIVKKANWQEPIVDSQSD